MAPPGRQDPRARPDLTANQVSTVSRARADRPAPRGLQDPQGRLASLATLDRQGRKWGLLAPADLADNLDPSASRGLPEGKGHRASKDPLGLQDHLDLLAPQDHRVR